MKRAKYVLSQKDMELICQFEITKQVQIKVFKVEQNENASVMHTKPLKCLRSSSLRCKKLASANYALSITKTRKKSFKCHLCNYSSPDKSNLKNHLWTHSAQKRFKCETCSFATNTNKYLQKHLDSTHNNNSQSRKRNFPCQLCDKSFFTISNVRAHLSTHTKERPFFCQFCNCAFATKGSQNVHEITCKQNPKRSDASWVKSQKKFDCKLCNRKFQTKSDLTTHIRSHTKEKPFRCNKCNYAAASASSLRSHVERKHNPNILRKFACTLCLRLFLTKTELSQHFITHTKKASENFACEFCRKTFLRKSDRNRHQLMCKLNLKHSDKEWVQQLKKFKCHLCKFSTTRANLLKTHLMTHTGQRPFKCTFCTYSSTNKPNLYRHLRMHTMEKPNKCPHCDFRGIEKISIQRHVKRHHTKS